MNRYEEIDESVVEVFLRVMEERFPKYQNYSFKLMYDTKRRLSKKKIVLASIEMASAKIRFFTADEVASDGYDYVMIIDKKAWELASDKDKTRLISHELNHVFVDEMGNPKLVGHDISDFYIEIKRNEDSPDWSRNLAIIVDAAYEQEKEEESKPDKGSPKGTLTGE